MSKQYVTTAGVLVPVRVELTCTWNAETEEADIISVALSPMQSLTVRDVTENMDDEQFAELNVEIEALHAGLRASK